MKEVPVYRGVELFRTAKVDDEDFNKCQGVVWRAIGQGDHFYPYFFRDKKIIRMHNHILDREASKVEVVDHINGDTFDNRRSNIRVCSVRENNCNIKTRPSKVSSKYTGVYRQTKNDLKSNRWYAAVMVNRKQIADRGYLNEKEAAHAYDNLAKEHHGEFARLNFPDEFIVPEKYKSQAGHKYIVLRKKPAYTSYIVQLHAIKNEKGYAYIKCFSILEEAITHRNEKLTEYNIPIPD